MVGAAVAPVTLQILQVEIEALHRRLPGSDHLHGPLVEGDWSEARRCAEALLSTAVADVDSPLVDLHVVAAQGCHGVDDGECAVAVDHLQDFRQRGQDAGGGLGVDDPDGLDAVMSGELVAEGLRVNGLAPG